MRSEEIHHEYLRQLCAEGKLVREGRGLYSLPDADVTVHHGLAQASKAIPKGVICLLSALRFHEIGTQAPHEVWMAIDRRAARPRVKHPRMRIVRFSGKALTEGIEERKVEGVAVRIYNPAKTVADCFKFDWGAWRGRWATNVRYVRKNVFCQASSVWRHAALISHPVSHPP